MANQKTHKSEIVAWILCLILLLTTGWFAYQLYLERQPSTTESAVESIDPNSKLAIDQLNRLPVKEPDSGDDYERENFSSSWASWRDCNVRQKILNRDIKNAKLAANGCTVIGGTLDDPYTGKTIELTTKTAVSKKVQIDHVVALANAWETGAKYLSDEERKALANDDLELISVSSSANQAKSDSDASEWLPDNVAFRCQYIARQIAVKVKYRLWVTNDEKAAMKNILQTCPDQPLPAQ